MGARADGILVFSSDSVAGGASQNVTSGVSPRIGLSVDVGSGYAVYANTSASLNPNAGVRGAGGVSLPPARSNQSEAGVKRTFAEPRLTATLDVYTIGKSRVPIADPTNPTVSVASGRQRSQGVEFELAGSPAPGWQVAASYAYTYAQQIDAQLVAGDTIAAGSRLPGVPRHAIGAWLEYDGPVWGGGVGVQAQTTREATLPNTTRLPAFARVDLSVWRRVTLAGHVARAQVDATNVTDAKTYDTDGAAFLRPRPPRSVYASMRWDF